MLATILLVCSSPLLATAAPQGDEVAVKLAPTIAWQRNLADALAEQKRTGLPLLIAVNTDGEVFNDRFAGTVYKDPAFVELTRGYICVVASPDPHNDRDYDALGNRVECPRFPGCTCSEHKNIEPLLFERWFSGTRNAPRHLGISTDGKVMFDRYLDNSMQLAIDAIREHRGDPATAVLAVPTEVAELFTRRDAASRRELERRYRTGDDAARIALLRAAGAATNEPFDLLRMGLRSSNDEVFRATAASLAAVATSDALIDVEDALARVADPALRGQLVARLGELGRKDPAAARLHSHFDIDGDARLPQPWRNAWRAAAFDGNDRESIEAELDRCEARLRGNPDDAATRLQLATAQAALGLWLANSGGKNVELWLSDAEHSAAKVGDETLAAEAAAVAAIAAWHRADPAAAAKAISLALATANSDRSPDAWLARNLLAVVAQSTVQNAYAKAQADANASLRGELTRTRLVLEMLSAREVVDETTDLLGYGLLEYAGRRFDARAGLRRLVGKLPGSAAVHERWRTRLLVDLGADAMRQAYAEFVDQAADVATAEWFAGYAALVAGEQHTRDARRDEAIAAYTDAVTRLTRSATANADFADSAHHFTVLGLAGRAELLHAAGNDEAAIADLLRAMALRAASLDADDGLQRKPRGIAGRIHRDLLQAGKAELAAKLQPLLP
ncbi:MAG: hypothetical protein H6838_13840 [Planctomycetes bacterium]|nr:hypothetical protein [Planctomycetota bacterium]MCB9886571.1 hypothetical protein [Planctomycetota bacterium]